MNQLTSEQTPPDTSYLIDAPTLKTWLEDRAVVLVDVREPGEYANEHIPGAQSIPLARLERSALNLESNQRLVLYCQSGKRSAQGAQKLAAAGVTDIHELGQGILAWKNAGYGVIKEAGAPISLFRQVQIAAGV